MKYADPPNDETDRQGRLLLDRINRVLDASMSVKFEVTDEPGSMTLAAISAPFILDLAEMTRVCLNDVFSYFEILDLNSRSTSNTDSNSLVDIGALISSEIAIQEVLDLTFVATSHLRFGADRLRRAINDQNLLAMVNSSEVVLTRLRRGLLPVEIALGDYTGIKVPVRTIGDIEGSIEVRRIYAGLRRAVLAIGRPSDSDLESLLTEFSNHLSALRSNAVATQIRINDRVQITALINRIGQWKVCEDPKDIEAGHTIWSDLATFASLLALTNNRQELIDHDRRIIARIFHELYANIRPPSIISEEMLQKLCTLEGRDDDLDQLILQRVNRKPADWEEPIRRLWHDLDQPSLETNMTRLHRK